MRRDHWHEERPTFFAYYVRATLHRRIFFLIGASLAVNGLIVGLMGHVIGGFRMGDVVHDDIRPGPRQAKGHRFANA